MKWHPTADVFCVWEATDNVFCVSSSVRWETAAVCFVAKIDFSSRCAVGRLSLRRHDDNLIGMGTDSGFFRTFADFCCWPDGSARYKVKFHHQRCDHCNKVNRGADDQVMKVGAHMETILGIFRRAWILIKKNLGRLVTFLTNGYHSTWESITVLCHALSTDWFCRGNIPGLKRHFQLFILTISTVKWKLNLGAIFIKFCEFLRSKGLFFATVLFREVLILVIIIIFNIIITMIITIIFMIIIHNDCKCLSSANKWCRLSDQCPSTGFAERIIIIILSSFHHICPHFPIFVIIPPHLPSFH